MHDPAGGLLTDLLRQVSRSFYLTLRVLPGAVRPQIGLAYLLARATDTVADTHILPVHERLSTLDTLRAAILGTTTLDAGFSQRLTRLADQQDAPAERLLLAKTELALHLLETFSEADRERIREVLATITGGQTLDLQRFAHASAQQIVTLANPAELDDYTYRVAGCVGEFWTRLCRAHLFPKAALDGAWLLAHGVRFGKGLQYVNILRDLPQDLRQGRCYLPGPHLASHSLEPADLLSPHTMPRFRHCYEDYLGVADAHLAAGWSYTNSLPRAQVRVRLACAWPLLLGIRTLEKLRLGNVLDDRHPIKVTRAEVRRLLWRSLLLYPFPAAWHALFERARTG